MKKSFLKLTLSLLLPALIGLPAIVEAASASGRVSANIVASASTSLTGTIALTPQTNQPNQVTLSTEGMDKAGLKVSSSGDMVYHVTISSTNTVTDTNGRRVTVEKLGLSSVSNQNPDSYEQEHYVSGAFSSLDENNGALNRIQTNADPYANMINITVNYN